VPHISDIPGKQRIGLPPVGAVIVEHLALRELVGADPTARSSGRIIADPIRGIVDHQLGLRAGNTGSTSAALVLSPQPTRCSQPPDVAGPGYRLLGDIRDAVGIAQTARPQTPQDLVKPIRLKANQIEIETAEFEITQLIAQQIEVPTSRAASSLSARR
jgi:hypothetical protein